MCQSIFIGIHFLPCLMISQTAAVLCSFPLFPSLSTSKLSSSLSSTSCSLPFLRVQTISVLGWLVLLTTPQTLDIFAIFTRTRRFWWACCCQFLVASSTNQVLEDSHSHLDKHTPRVHRGFPSWYLTILCLNLGVTDQPAGNYDSMGHSAAYPNIFPSFLPYLN